MKELNPEFKKIVIEIERMRHEMDMTRASINSWLLNLRDPKAEREYLNMYIERLTEDLNTQANLQSQLENLIHLLKSTCSILICFQYLKISQINYT